MGSETEAVDSEMYVFDDVRRQARAAAKTPRGKRLAFSSNAYLRYSFVRAAESISRIGYAGIEIMADVPHAWPAYLLEEQKEAIRRSLRQADLAISNINAFMMNAINDPRQKYWHPSWIEPDRHYRQIRIDHTIRALDLAKELGSPCITTEPGGPLEPGQSWNAGLKIFLESLKPVIAHAEKTGVLLLIEPEPGLLIETAEQFEEFMKHIDSPSVGLNFDVGHFYCVKDEPAPTVHRLAKWMKHVHLEDIAATRVHHHLIPGDGAIDFAGVFKALDAVNYQGWVTIELYPYVDDPDLAARTARERVLAIIEGKPA
jgi:sugar phosphate isomerase/epimerase